jgi:DDE superfamily endonuclease
VPTEALKRRMRRWARASNIVQRRNTHVAQNTRYDAGIMEEFTSYVNGQIESGGYTADLVVNIDETNIEFDMTGTMTLAPEGAQTVSIRTSGSSSRCTVLLGVTLSGIKLPPFIIFKGSATGRLYREWTCAGTQYPNTSKYAVQAKAWIDSPTMLEWIDKVWAPFCDGKPPTYLLMDECTVHKTASVKTALEDLSTEVDFIVKGYTSKLQVLDVGVNKPFKHYMRESYEHHMVVNNGRKASRLDVANWVAEAWGKVKVESITNTWRSIGIGPNAAINPVAV